MALAALSGWLAVAAGAFGAHAAATPAAREWLRTGSTYQMTHALAVFACGLASAQGAALARPAAWLFLAGAALFSGSLYAMALGAPPWLGAVTPLGGLALLAGWAVLALALLRPRGPGVRT
jgi:uncharacterized membrane protein YgdD (TMEM256/DUF423 family)